MASTDPTAAFARRTLVVVLIISACALTVWLLQPIFTPLVIAFVLAYLLNPFVTLLEKLRLKRRLAIAVLSLFILAFLAASVMYVVPALYDRFSTTIEKIPRGVDNLVKEIDPLLRRIRTHYPNLFRQFLGQSVESVKRSIPTVLAPTLQWLSTASTDLMTLFLNMMKLLLVPVFTFYLLNDFPKLGAKLRETIPHRRKQFFEDRLREIDQALNRFVRGQLLIGLIYGAIYATGLELLGIPLAITVGLSAGILNIVPYLGTTLGLLTAVALSLLDGLRWPILFGILLTFALAQSLDAAVLTPRILGNQVGLHPVVILLGIIVFAKFFGIVGIALAVPVMATVAVFLRAFYREYLGSEFYRRT